MNRLECSSCGFCYYIQIYDCSITVLLNFTSYILVSDLIPLLNNVNKRVSDILMTSVEGYYKSLKNCNSLPLMVLKIVLFYGSKTVGSLSFPYEK